MLGKTKFRKSPSLCGKNVRSNSAATQWPHLFLLSSGYHTLLKFVWTSIEFCPVHRIEQYVPFFGGLIYQSPKYFIYLFCKTLKGEGEYFCLLAHITSKSPDEIVAQKHWFLRHWMVRFCFQKVKYLRILCWNDYLEWSGNLY